MKTFLQEVAHDLFVKLDGDFSNVMVVFPNKRAQLFFDEYLAHETNKPLWAPMYANISDLFQNLSPLKKGDPIQLVCLLYTIFKEQTNGNETLDSFYPWGQILISDFDDADKNLVNTNRLFENLYDLKNEIDNLSYLTKEQEDALKQFFNNFSIERQTELKRKFSDLWNKLGVIYNEYKNKLNDKGIAYEGMIYRSVIENIELKQLPYSKYVFVGFNVLNKVEKELFTFLHKAEKAMFYWDYDKAYLTIPEDKSYRYEAGEFIYTNIRLFPNELNQTYFNNLMCHKKVTYISSTTENAQARYVSKWAKESINGAEKENAIVLCNESLLLPILHSIPENIQNVNITMGFPMSQTPIFNFIKAILNLQINGYDQKRNAFLYPEIRIILDHPYTQAKSNNALPLIQELTHNNCIIATPLKLHRDDFLAQIFTHQETNEDLCLYLIQIIQKIAYYYNNTNIDKGDFDIQLHQESAYQCYLIINRLLSLIENNDLNVEAHTLDKLLTGILRTTSIPFHGEPAIGMQIMGILETRNLNFRNILMTSVNEGQLPKSNNDTSFIPYNIRKAFGMTTIEHKNAVYAYYFYRLIQRAESITLLYNSNTNGLSKGEMSRFMLQYLVEYPHDIRREYLDAKKSLIANKDITIEKNNDIIQQLVDRFKYDGREDKNPILSPSALNDYLDCSLRFYFRYIAKLKTPDEVNLDIDNSTFGTIFHDSAKLLYQKYVNKEIKTTDIQQIRPYIERIIDTVFKKDFFHVTPEQNIEYNGIQHINRTVIEKYLNQLLNIDFRYTPFSILKQEESISEILNIKTDNGTIPILIGGTVDRIDIKNNIIRIIDYKTGQKQEKFMQVEDLFTKSKHPKYILQTFLYATIIHHQSKEKKIKPALLYIGKASSEDYSPHVSIVKDRKEQDVEDIAPYEEEFCERLHILIDEIFSTDIPFTQVTDKQTCQYCDFNRICRRNNNP